MVYTYGNNINQVFGKMIGNVNCIIPLDSSYANKEIRIEITPYYTQTFEIRDIILDNTNLIYYNILSKNIWRILIVFILIILGSFLLFLNLYRNLQNITYQKKTLIYYFLFVSTIATWVFCSSDLPQFISQRSGLYSYLSFMLFILLDI